MQEAEDGKHHQLLLHKEDDQLPQSQERAQVEFQVCKNFVKNNQFIAGLGVSFSTQLIGADRVQGHQARTLKITFFNKWPHAGMTPAVALSPAIQMSPAFQLSHNQHKLISPQVHLDCFQNWLTYIYQSSTNVSFLVEME